MRCNFHEILTRNYAFVNFRVFQNKASLKVLRLIGFQFVRDVRFQNSEVLCFFNEYH